MRRRIFFIFLGVAIKKGTTKKPQFLGLYFVDLAFNLCLERSGVPCSRPSAESPLFARVVHLNLQFDVCRCTGGILRTFVD